MSHPYARAVPSIFKWCATPCRAALRRIAGNCFSVVYRRYVVASVEGAPQEAVSTVKDNTLEPVC